MGFLDKSNLNHGRLAEDKHPLLVHGDVPLNVRQMYLQGCVLAVLERKDGKLTKSDKTGIQKLGAALEMDDKGVSEAISTMSNLKSPEAQKEFLDEFFIVLAGEKYPRFFMKDFEPLLKGDGELSEDAGQTLDYFGKGLTGSKNWRECCKCEDVEDATEELPDIQNVTNLEAGAKAYLAAAEAGNAHAQGCLAYCYAKTRSENDAATDEKMLEFAKKSATQGDAVGQWVLGFFFSEGIGTERDFAEGAKWYRKAADQGDAGAQADLAFCYAQGHGLTESITEAIKWWRKAAKQGNATAQSNLGICYGTGNGVTENKCEAVKWFRKAAEQGNAISQNCLGDCYANGEGVVKDEEESAKWYRRAAKQGNPNAQCNLGDCYLNGQGVSENEVEAVKWFRKAAKQGNAIGQYKLGWCYCHGCGVPMNKAESIRWLQMVVDGGGELANDAEQFISELKNETAFQEWDRNISNKIDGFFDNLFG